LGEVSLAENIFNLQNAGFSYRAESLLFTDLNLSIEAGESICLLGANGSGKSSLLKILCALNYIEIGSFKAFGYEISEKQMENDNFCKDYYRRVGFVFQNSDAQLFTTRVWDEIAFGPLQMDFPRKEIQNRVNDIIKVLQIEHLANRPPFRLSGGEKKKVALASILVLNPEVIILDEPTAGLDPRSQNWLVDLLLQLNSVGRTIIVATHDLNLAHTLTKRTLLLSEEHKVVYDGDTQESLRNTDLLMKVNLIDQFTHIHEQFKHLHIYVHC
jgi:cobalt/nickel transport system ATP-binding protein